MLILILVIILALVVGIILDHQRQQLGLQGYVFLKNVGSVRDIVVETPQLDLGPVHNQVQVFEVGHVWALAVGWEAVVQLAQQPALGGVASYFEDFPSVNRRRGC